MTTYIKRGGKYLKSGGAYVINNEDCCCGPPPGCGCDVSALTAAFNLLTGCACVESTASVYSASTPYRWSDSCKEWFGTFMYKSPCVKPLTWIGYYINFTFGCTADGTYRLYYNINGGGSDEPCGVGEVTATPTSLHPF